MSASFSYQIDDEDKEDVGESSFSLPISQRKKENEENGNPLTIITVQKEDLADGEAISAKLAGILKPLLIDLKNSQCFVLVYGAAKPDFLELIKLVGSIQKRGVKVLCCTEATGSTPKLINPKDIPQGTVIKSTQVPSAMSKGNSIIYHMPSKDDLGRLSNCMSVCAEVLGKDCSKVKFIIIIEKSATLNIAHQIRDLSDDKGYFTTAEDEENERQGEVAYNPRIKGRYNLQITPTEQPNPTILSKEWENSMMHHEFRNAFFPSFGADELVWSLDYLSIYAAYNPFGETKLYAVTLLTSKGEGVKKLLEAWYNYVFGTSGIFWRCA